MPNTDSKTYIVNDQPLTNGETDALDFMPREAVETLADIVQTGNTRHVFLLLHELKSIT